VLVQLEIYNIMVGCKLPVPLFLKAHCPVSHTELMQIRMLTHAEFRNIQCESLLKAAVHSLG